MSKQSIIHWTEGDAAHSARWHSETSAAPPSRVVIAGDQTTADEAYGLACQGMALLWRGDFQNAKQLLVAMGRRFDRRSQVRKKTVPAPHDPATAFHLYRQTRAQRARALGALLVELDEDYVMSLRRAPDVRQACREVYGPGAGASVMSLRTLLGLIGAHEWRSKGIDVAAIGGRIHPHYGVFAPIRSEYLELLAATPLPALTDSLSVAFDIGTGTGVVAALLARRGIRQVIATDLDARALECAAENVLRLGLAGQVQVQERDLFPEGLAALVVCNPPWLPARPSSAIERGIYDPDGHMLREFLKGLPRHLAAGGEGWLILSDLAEHLGLRSRAELLQAFDAAQLQVIGEHRVRPTHARASDTRDPLYQARAAEVTSLWRLSASPGLNS
ncbi:MAG TPA: class I SAM-dependent methyltransferase [Steroidobacteraceae bacterium]|nr:class I SAM-dependent methyltransferase [Steroidobacteraceae bacterium]